MKRRKMSALQRKYFGKRTKRVRAAPIKRRRKRVVLMARRRRGGFRRGVSRATGGYKSMLAPILGGLGDSIIDPISPVDGIGGTAVGMFMHNETVKNIGLYKVGYSLGGILPIGNLLGGLGGTKSGGFN